MISLVARSNPLDSDPDGNEDGGGVIRGMPMDVDRMTELATSALARSLTDDECRRFLHTDGCAAR